MKNSKISILVTEVFKKNYKSLSKKYPSINKDLLIIAEELKIKPDSGISLGNNCYKIRLKITSKNKGKSSGARLITYYRNEKNEVYLLTIYDKSSIINISPNEINEIIKSI